MKQEDKRYEEWLKDVRNRQPMMSNPEELTANIMQRVARMPKRNTRRKILIGSRLSGVAAVLLLCLLVGDLFHTPMPDDGRAGEWHLNGTQAGKVNLWQESTTCALPEGWGKMHLAEKGEYLFEQYIQPKQMRQKKIKELIKKTD